MSMLNTYHYDLPGASHWSFRIKRGNQITLTDTLGTGNVATLFYNPDNLLERYNAPDTLKCQHTFKLSKGHCLYSDMGRVFCSIIEDSHGWHETVCGNSHASHIESQWGKKHYQEAHNERHQNGYDSFLVELAKYGLSKRDMAANINFFSKVTASDEGQLALDATPTPGAQVTLRFEMDTLVILHNCPHPLNKSTDYPFTPIGIQIEKSAPVTDDDFCMNFRPENKRGFENNALYHLGSE